MKRPQLLLTSFFGLGVIVSCGFMVGGFTQGGFKGDFVGVLGVAGIAFTLLFLYAVVRQRRSESSAPIEGSEVDHTLKEQ